MLGKEVVAGKKAMKLGDCQCVRPGRMCRDISGRIEVRKDSGFDGADGGRWDAR